MRILLTGFEPFGNYKENSSWAVAEKVAALGFEGVSVTRLPVTFAGVAAALRKAVDECRPDAIVMLGQSAGIDYIKLERIAINMMDSSSADNDGYIPDEEPIYPGGEAALFTNTKIKEQCRAVVEQGIPAKVSNSAGLYVCNRLYYEALQLCKEYTEMRALFVHLPLYDGQPMATVGKQTMPLGDMVKAIKTIIHKINDTSTKIQETAFACF